MALLAEDLKKFDVQLTASKKSVSEKMVSITQSNVTVSQKKTDAQKAKAELEKKQVVVHERKTYVSTKLERAEPALIEAENAVRGVTAGNITEIKNLAKPPEKVRIALEPVIILITKGKAKPAWDAVRKVLANKDFKDSILNFKKEEITPTTKKFILDNYLKDEKAYDIDAF